jgi:hypothetical protein
VACAPQRPGLFSYMVETVLRRMPGRTATAGQICQVVTEDADLSSKLQPTDWVVRSGLKRVPR